MIRVSLIALQIMIQYQYQLLLPLTVDYTGGYATYLTIGLAAHSRQDISRRSRPGSKSKVVPCGACESNFQHRSSSLAPLVNNNVSRPKSDQT